MALGTLVFYFGIAALTSSFTAVLAVLLFAVLLIAYLKFVEERELTLRFGDGYERCRRSTPFIIPRLSLRRGRSWN
jgi:protein-S-isoprenylcysteine O-methyltransferase Ste14